MQGKKVAFKTLGCRLNQFETDALASEFDRQGFKIVEFNEKADVYVINTCTVTNQSDHKSRNIIRQAERKKEDSILVVTGCMADHFKESLENEQGINYLIQNDQKSSLVSLVEAHYKGEIISPSSFEKDKFGFGIADKGFHTRAMIKIQDGCDNYCSFCIVPRVRGRAISRPFQDIKDNIRKVLDAGFKEIVLTGVNIGRYEHEGMNFEKLLEKLLKIPGDFRVRISSMEPDGFGDRFFELFAHPKLTPHLHLCLQSGSENILLKMRRMYTVKTFMGMTERLKTLYPDFNLSTDIIVGFPGETEKDFEESCNVSKEIGFSHIHTFKYSVRNGTRAARMQDQIPEKLKSERSEIIRQISSENRISYFTKMLGKEQLMLTERSKKGSTKGYGQNYIPIVLDHKHSRNEFVQTRLVEITDDKEPVIKGRVI
ncbi:MAG: tRNA (N(6)-L-threonylcarbamoyladenosine(37)-C(2))-methylthiotransferase MtaB [Bacteroidota bacterium]|nr:tRNA (N(6)-L-threonylcarbamoyladenosine(37)-C(2))-methylthiotransferase MtaB [Bacteroidota bacterium]